MVFEINKVLISDDIDAKCVDILQSNGIEVVKNTKLSKEELIAEIPKYEALIVRSATKVTSEVLAAGCKLRIVGRAGTGVDNIDVEAATRAGVVVMNTPGGNTLSAAEHTCTLLVSLARNLGEANMSMKAGKWDRKKFMGNELYGKTLAIIGLGRIGREVAERMQSFGMTTIGFDPLVTPAQSAEFRCEWLALDDIWPRADYITVHTPLIPQTKHLLCDATFAKCKPGVRVVNCARGGIIEEAALLRALEAGRCGGAGLDVFVEEPPKDYTLAKHPLVVATPHLGASTHEAQARVAEDIARQFVDLRDGKTLFGAINAPALGGALSLASGPWVALGRALGAVGGAVVAQGAKLEALKVTVMGKGQGQKDVEDAVVAAALAGLMTSQGGGAGGEYNLVNAPALAKQQGLQTSVTRIGGGYGVTLQLCAPGTEPVTVSGVPGSAPMLTSLQTCEFRPPLTLQGHVMLYNGAAGLKLADLMACAAKDGLEVRAVATSDGTFGGVNLAARPASTPALQGLVAQLYRVAL